MSRAIFCLVFVAIVASIGQGRVIEKRSPGGASDLAAKIDKAVDLKAIGGHIDKAIDKVEDFGSDAIDWTKGAAKTVGGAFVDAGSAIGDFLGGLGRKKREFFTPFKDRNSIGSDPFNIDPYGQKFYDKFGRKKRSPGVGADLAGKIDKAVDLEAIGGHIDKAIDAVEDFGSDAIDWTKGAANTVGDFFGGLGRKKRSPGVADLAGKLDEAVNLKAIGGHIDDAIDDIKDFANSDGVRRVGNKIADAASDVGDAIGDFFG